MPKRRPTPNEHSAFARLPVRHVTVGDRDDRLAVHVAGRLSSGRVPLICIAGYHRNMSDFSAFVPLFHSLMGDDWPVVLVDLRGRGRSSDRRSADDYGSPGDVLDVIAVAHALGIEAAIFVGQGYGGQMIMALAAERPTLIAGAILIDAGPVTTPRSLVRLRTNLDHIASLRGEAGLRATFRQILGADYPEAPDEKLDMLAARTHFLDRGQHAVPLFDPSLLVPLQGFTHDNSLLPQWPLFGALKSAPLLLVRTQFSDQLPAVILEEMLRHRADARSVEIEGQGSPALLDQVEHIEPIAEFVRQIKGATAWPVPKSAAAEIEPAG